MLYHYIPEFQFKIDIVKLECHIITSNEITGNIREVLIPANLARRTNSRIQESRDRYYYNSATYDISSKMTSTTVKTQQQ